MASASSEAGSTRSQEIEELERFIDSYVLEYQVQGLLGDKADGDLDLDNGSKVPQVRTLLLKWMVMLSTGSGGVSDMLAAYSLHQNSRPYCCDVYVNRQIWRCIH